MIDMMYDVVACAIKKDEARRRYASLPRNPYRYSLNVVVERFVFELQRAREQGILVLESRGGHLDRQIEGDWERIKRVGTKYVSGEDIRANITGFSILNKAHRVPGLELADLVATPIGRYVAHGQVYPDFEIIREKFCRKEGRWDGAGLVVIPR
jgi:hypothetical protein